MLYKISTDINTLNEAIEEFQKVGSFCLSRNIAYLYTDVDIKEVKYVKGFKILTFNNYKSYSNNSKSIEKWCYEKLCEEELKQYEQSEDCQNKLRELNQYMDVLESKMGVNSVVEKQAKKTEPKCHVAKATAKRATAKQTTI